MPQPPSSSPAGYQPVCCVATGAAGRVLLAVREQTAASARRERQVFALPGQTQARSRLVEQETIALKVLTKEPTEPDKAKFLEECKLLRKCAHPLVAKFHFVATDTDGKLVLGMEYCAGGDLFSLSERAALGPPQIRFYAAEVAQALGFLHSKNVFYGDLKPENIAIATDGHIRLVDFGLAVQLSDETHQRDPSGRLVVVSSAGTLGYTAPEILRRMPHGLEADWWSFGILLYYLALDILPWDAESPRDTCNAICLDPVPFLEDITDPALADLISGLLTKQQLERIGAHDDVAELAQHAFFAGHVDLVHSDLRRSLRPPWMPTLRGLLDTSNFLS